MIYEPHDYQKYAINFIKENPIAAVLLDMGLGKTSITLTAINDLLFDSFDVRKVIVSLRCVWHGIHGLPRSISGIISGTSSAPWPSAPRSNAKRLSERKPTST